LDIDLPDIDGFNVCREIRSFSDVPIIIVTGCSDDQDIVKGLEWGADDYIIKPFSYIQFLARVQAVIRRVRNLPLSSSMQPFVTKDLAVHFDTRVVRANGKDVKLTNIEYSLLLQLMKNADRPVPADILLTKVWGPQYGDMPPEQEIRPDPNDPNTLLLIPLGGHLAKSKRYLLKVHIQHLRKKIEWNPGAPRVILTDRGVGYRFVPPS
jgi:DNA-binding response OmpR family regulator